MTSFYSLLAVDIIVNASVHSKMPQKVSHYPHLVSDSLIISGKVSEIKMPLFSILVTVNHKLIDGCPYQPRIVFQADLNTAVTDFANE